MGSLLVRARRPREWAWSGPPGDHSPFPTDPAPYPGYPLTYCFLDVLAKFRVMEERVNLGPTAVTTNVEDFLGELAHCYQQGFRLHSFIRVPGLNTAVEVLDWSDRIPYQAILSRRDTIYKDKDDNVDIVLAKKILSTKFMEIDCFDEEHSMLVGIKSIAAKGGRLVCAEPIGYMRSNTNNYQIGAIGVELFFNIPKTNSISSPKYTYHALKLPARYHINLDPTQTIQQIECETDFNAQMKEFLEKGWKMVDIVVDTVALAEAFRMKSSLRYIDTLWLFEKEQNLLTDDTPRYEGVVIEYLHKVKNTMTGDYPCNDWRPIIAAMGVMGWELVTILQTPAIVQTTFTNYTIKLIMIFQRRLIPSFEYYRGLKGKTQVANGKKAKTNTSNGGVYTAKGLNQKTSGYFNSVLKKYVYGSTEQSSLHMNYCESNGSHVHKSKCCQSPMWSKLGHIMDNCTRNYQSAICKVHILNKIDICVKS